MANDDLLNRVIAFTMPKFLREFQDGMAKMAVEYYWAVKNKLFTFDQGGKEIQWRARVRRGSPFGFTGGTEGNTFSVRNDYEVATLQWKGIGHGVCVTKAEVWQNRKPEQIKALLPQLLDDMRDDLIDEFCKSFYGSGTRLNSKTFQGLQASIGTGLTYAGLSTSTYTQWASQYVDGSGFRSDPFSLLLDLKIACAVGLRGGRTRNKLDIFLAPSPEYKAAIMSADAKRRFTQDAEMATAGFENVEAHGVPLAWSEYADSQVPGKVYGLNSNFFEFPCGTSELFEVETEWTQALPKLFLGYGLSHFNMMNKNPRASGVLYNTDL